MLEYFFSLNDNPISNIQVHNYSHFSFIEEKINAPMQGYFDIRTKQGPKQ